MIDLIDNRILLIVGCTALVLAGLIGVLSAVIRARREEARRRQLVAVSEVSRDWQPTWRINAVTDAWVMEHEKDDIPLELRVAHRGESHGARYRRWRGDGDPLAATNQGRGPRDRA